jgi:hypothetical protein
MVDNHYPKIFGFFWIFRGKVFLWGVISGEARNYPPHLLPTTAIPNEPVFGNQEVPGMRV